MASNSPDIQKLLTAITLAAASFTGCASRDTVEVEYSPLSSVSAGAIPINMMDSRQRLAVLDRALDGAAVQSYTVSHYSSDEMVSVRRSGEGPEKTYELLTHARLDPAVVTRGYLYDGTGKLVHSQVDPKLAFGNMNYGDLILKDLETLLGGGLKPHTRPLVYD